MSVLIETTIGDLVFDLYIEERPRCKYNLGVTHILILGSDNVI